MSIDNLKRKADACIEDASETLSLLIEAYESRIAHLERRIVLLEQEKCDLMDISRMQTQHVNELLRQLKETKEVTK